MSNIILVFLTKPEFKLKQLPKYQIRLTSISSPRYCEKSITSTTNITTNQVSSTKRLNENLQTF